MADEMALLVADVYELAGLLRRRGEEAAAREGQTQARWQLLSALSDEALTAPQAARRLGVTRQGVQRVANDLIAADLVELQPNPDHRTSPLLVPTTEGQTILRAITARAVVLNDELADALGVPALQSTRLGIRRLIDALKHQAVAD